MIQQVPHFVVSEKGPQEVKYPMIWHLKLRWGELLPSTMKISFWPSFSTRTWYMYNGMKLKCTGIGACDPRFGGRLIFGQVPSVAKLALLGGTTASVSDLWNNGQAQLYAVYNYPVRQEVAVFIESHRKLEFHHSGWYRVNPQCWISGISKFKVIIAWQSVAQIMHLCISDTSSPFFLPSLLFTPAKLSDWSKQRNRFEQQNLMHHRIDNSNQWRVQITKYGGQVWYLRPLL